MEKWNRLRWDFTVSVSPGSRFLTALRVMRLMADMATMAVGHDEIQVVAYNQELSVMAALVMKATTTLTFPEDPFVLFFHLDTTTTPMPSVLKQVYSQLQTDSLRIFKVKETTAIHFTAGAGQEDVVIGKLGEAIFSEQARINIEGLKKHSVVLTLSSYCFSQLIATFALNYPDVTLTAHTDRIIATAQPTPGLQPPILTLLTQNAQAFQCGVRGVMPGTAEVLVLRWPARKEIETLANAVRLSQVVEIYTLVHEGGTGWILFRFPADENNYFAFLMPPSSAAGR